jgi:DNA-binding CsgD family transcriptional regulator
LSGVPETGLHDRLNECAVMRRLLDEARAGSSPVLVVRGDAGIGKSALLDYVTETASGFRIARTAGVESEMPVPFAGLRQLCDSMVKSLHHLPTPQRNALTTAFGLTAGAPPDRFFVALAVLSLFDYIAEDQPLLVVVDDVGWMDDASVQALAFVARRLLAEPIAMVLAARSDEDPPAVRGLPELVVGALPEADARAVLADSLHVPVDAAVLDQIVAECDGNPLALMELPRALSATDLAGGFALADALPVRTRIENSFGQRLDTLPAPTRQLLVTAAAEPSGDLGLLRKAATTLGIDTIAAEPAEAAGLISFDRRARFRHPLVRSTAYRGASAAERREAHRALAKVMDPDRDPDRRAWHRALSAPAAEEDVAADLERSACRAQARGGLSAAAAFLTRAAALTPDPARRASRTLAAAQATAQAGGGEAATALLRVVAAGPLDDLQRAQVDLLRGQIAFVSSHGRDATPLLLSAARQFGPLDPGLARDTYLDAIAAALFIGRFGESVSIRDVAVAARAAARSGGRPSDLLLDGLSATIADGYAVGAPRLKRAVAAFRTQPLSESEAVRWLWLATHAAHDLWDDDSWDALCSEHLRITRRLGALAILPLALSARIGLHLFAGELALAASLVDEVAGVTEATGNRLPPYGALALAAFRGREAEASELVAAALNDVHTRGEGMGLTLVQHSQAVLYNGLGRFDEARAAAAEGAAHPEELAFSTWSLVQLVEAAARSGRTQQAADALERLTRVTDACDTKWARGIAARSRALLADGGRAEELYREALEELAGTRMLMEVARARLLFGEWLRAQGRQGDARDELRRAHDMFSGMGANAFAGRARRELAAAGHRVRARRPGRVDALTAKEAQIARLAVTGQTNQEIGAQLFVSPRTVEWHLSKVFAKLGITSRQQLRAALGQQRQEVRARADLG